MRIILDSVWKRLAALIGLTAILLTGCGGVDGGASGDAGVDQPGQTRNASSTLTTYPDNDFIQPSPADDDVSTVEERGYIPMSDGVRLRYTVIRPENAGGAPTLLIFDGYSSAVNPRLNGHGGIVDAALARGFAIVGVGVRGTGCSEGTFDLTTDQDGLDGAEVVRWITEQAWSDGNVGMFGASYPGITQYFVAGQKPAGLKAIAPGVVHGSIYRDVVYPGGIYNAGFAAFFTANRRFEASEGQLESVENDPECLENAATRIPPENAGTLPVVQATPNPYIDDENFVEHGYNDRSPQSWAPRVDIPVLAQVSWQDGKIGSRSANMFEMLDSERTWIIGMNGRHGEYVRSAIRPQIIAFFERFVAGRDNGFEDAVPHVQIWHEHDGDAPAWVSGFDRWPVAGQPSALYLREGGKLAGQLPADAEQPTAYTVPADGGGNPSGAEELALEPLFDETDGQPPDPFSGPATPSEAQAIFTSAPLAEDVMTVGAASLDLWLSSSAPDTDLQVTLTEIRPDGQEIYVQRGWLRASHRALVPERSLPYRPIHQNTRAAAQNLTVGQATPLRVQIMPFAHVFRAGSRIRVSIGSPVGFTGYWIFQPLLLPALNQIHHTSDMASRLVLNVIPSGRAQAPLPDCGQVKRQPCRDAASSNMPEGSAQLTPVNE